MIAYLKGTIVTVTKINNQRVILILDVNNIGYEIQVPPKWGENLIVGEDIQIFTHGQIREDQVLLYGFASTAEKELFRQLIGVSGIGTQLAIALLDTLGLTELVQAIVTGNTKILIKTPGVGGKIAERIALELRSKLAQWRKQAGLPPVKAKLTAAIQEDVEMTLLALGYSNKDVAEALGAMTDDLIISQSKDAEDWIRGAISWLNRQ